MVFAVLEDFAANLGYVCAIDRGPSGSLATLLAIDLALVAVFGVSHSVLARPSVKRVLPASIERTTYLLVASATLGLLIWQWRAIPDVVWNVGPAAARDALWAVQLAGAALLVYATFLTDHFDLFGLRQVWLSSRGRAYTPVPLVERSLYRHVRHPMMTGLIVWLWAPPTMTIGHLVFAASMTLYTVVGVYFEERGLACSLGAPYVDYRTRVPAFVPTFRSRAS